MSDHHRKPPAAKLSTLADPPETPRQLHRRVGLMIEAMHKINKTVSGVTVAPDGTVALTFDAPNDANTPNDANDKLGEWDNIQ